MTFSHMAWLVAGVLVVGCGDDDGPAPTPDAGPGVDSCATCVPEDSGTGEDAFVPPVDGGMEEDGGGVTSLPADPVIIALSATGHDRVHAVTHDADGNVYATG